MDNYRYYNPELGRWTKRDPIGEKGGYNLYGMVGNDAVSITDFIGLVELEKARSYGKNEKLTRYLIFIILKRIDSSLASGDYCDIKTAHKWLKDSMVYMQNETKSLNDFGAHMIKGVISLNPAGGIAVGLYGIGSEVFYNGLSKKAFYSAFKMALLKSNYGKSKVNEAFNKHAKGIIDDDILGKAIDAGEKIYDKLSSTVVTGWGYSHRQYKNSRDPNRKLASIKLNWTYNPLTRGKWNLSGVYIKYAGGRVCCKVRLKVDGNWGFKKSDSDLIVGDANPIKYH
jgi:hypothetical protein